MAELHGTCDDQFAAVRRLLQDNLDSGAELGASLVVDIDGHLAVDLWGGYRDEDRTLPWTADTITNVWSSTKPVTSLAALMLVDQGELDPAAPVAKYWPEFAANGKQDVTVSQVMSHSSGVSGLAHPAVLADLYDWEQATTRMAAQAPWWPPGSASGYHALNYGHLVGELVRRITGQPPSSSSRPRSPARWAPISRSARPSRIGRGSRTWCRHPRCPSTCRRSTRPARPTRR